MEQSDFSQPVAKLPKLKFNKRLQIILICFVVSVVFWFLIAMSKTYTGSFIFPVQYINLPVERIVVNDLPKSIVLSVKTTGFHILSYSFSKSMNPVIIDVQASLAGKLDIRNDQVSVPSKSFTGDFSRQLGNEYFISGFAPDSIVFSFSYKISKRVPVILQSDIDLEKQFDTTGSALIIPDSVTISGPADLIASVSNVKTEMLRQSGVKNSINTKLDLVSERLVATDVNQVTVTVPVEKFTEGTVEVPLHPINVAQGYSLKTFPDKVTVQYRISLSKYNEVRPEMFDAIVDASGLPDPKIKQLKVRLETIPVYVKSVRIDPAKTDYILRK